MTPDVNQVKLRGTVTDVFSMVTKSGQDRLAFTILTKSEKKGSYGDTVYTQQYTTCVAWSTAAKIFKEKMQVGTRVQVVGELHTYTSQSQKNPGTMVRKTEIVTKQIEVIGFDSEYKPRERVEFSVVDDFSDLD